MKLRMTDMAEEFIKKRANQLRIFSVKHYFMSVFKELKVAVVKADMFSYQPLF